jgi:hypothetical protein
LAEHPLSKDELLNSGIVDEWLDLSFQTAEGEFKYSTDVRVQSLSIATDIWMTFPQKVEESEHRATTLVSLLKRSSRDKSQALSLMSLSNLFRLLSHFGNTRNPYAPLIYKSYILINL